MDRVMGGTNGTVRAFAGTHSNIRTARRRRNESDCWRSRKAGLLEKWQARQTRSPPRLNGHLPRPPACIICITLHRSNAQHYLRRWWRQQAPPLVRRWHVVELGQPKQQQQRPPAGHPHREAATSQPKPQPDGRTEAESEHQRQSSVVGGIGLVIIVCSSCWQRWWCKPAEEEAELQ